MRSFRLALAFGAALLAAAACSDPAGPSGGGGDPGPPHMVIVSGDAQQGTAGAELGAPLVVRVLSDKGKPVSGQVVNFVVVSGGGHVFAGTGITDANGEARERWTLGNVAADSQKVEARAVDTSTGAPLVFATFRATARADVPASVGPAGSANFAGLPGLPLADSVAARVLDKFGNPVPGVAVVWTVVKGGGSTSPGTSTTGADGVARTRWTLGAQLDSTQVLQAAAGLTTTAQFTANAQVPVDAVVVKVSGDAQADSAGRLLAQPLVVRVQRANGTPVAGIPVTFAAAGGSVNPASVTTGPDGLASTRWTLPTTAGTASVTASIATFSSVAFSGTATAGPAATLEKVAGEGQTGTAGAPLRDSLAVRARDAYGNAVPGVQVTWSSAAGVVSPATSATRADGTTRAAYTLPGTSGTYTVQAAAAGVTPVTFTFTANGTAESVTRVDLLPDSLFFTAKGQQIALDVRAYDARGNVVTGVPTTVFSLGQNTVFVIGDPVRAVAGRSGTTRLVAVVGNVSDTSVAVVMLPATRVAVTERTAFVVVQDTVALHARVEDADGTALAVPVTWSSSNPGAATVDQNGRVHGVAPGSTVVYATYGTLRDSSQVTVYPQLLARRISGEDNYSCAIDINGKTVCWGISQNEVRPYSPAPVAVSGPALDQITSSSATVCGLDAAGKAYCWGRNSAGELGTGNQTPAAQPTPVSGGMTWDTISTGGGAHTCAINTAGAAYCWGSGRYGMLGTGDTVSSFVPKAVAGGLTFTEIAVGVSHTCALTTDGAAYCWGLNNSGELGFQPPTGDVQCFDRFGASCRTTPVAVSGGHKFTAISAGFWFTCGIATDGLTYCWGAGNLGQLGTGTSGFGYESFTPVPTSGNHHFTRIDVENNTACGIEGGALYCWGYFRNAPTAVASGYSVAQVGVGQDQTCFLTPTGAAYCVFDVQQPGTTNHSWSTPRRMGWP